MTCCPMTALLSQKPLCLNKVQSLAIFAFRVVLGAAFICHGWPKLQHATTWMDMMGTGTPAVIQATAAFAECGGGVAVLLGLFTPLASLGIVATMIGALVMVHLPAGHPFVSMGGPSYEPALFYLVSALWLMVSGPGAFSVDALLAKQSCNTTACEDTATSCENQTPAV